MATNVVCLRGDSSAMTLKLTNLTGPDPLEFIVGSFRSTPEERRVATVVLIIGGNQRFQVRFEFTSGVFVEHTITGKPLAQETAPGGQNVER